MKLARRGPDTATTRRANGAPVVRLLPRLSVIVPATNAPPTLDRCLSAVEPRLGPGDELIVVREPEAIVNVFEQADAGERIGLVNFVANPREVRAVRHEFTGDMQRTWPCAGILKRACVGGNGREQAVGNGFGDGPARRLEQAINQLAGRWFAG